IDQHGTLDVQIQAQALLGRTLVALKKDADAEKSYARVRDAWHDPAAALANLEKASGSEADQPRRIGKTLTAVGEALFFFAEKERVKAEATLVPPFKGKSEVKEIDAFVRGPFAAWYQKRRAALQEVERRYLAIVELRPVPPPKWVVASGAAVGRMWARMADELRAAPYPKDWDKSGDVPGIHPP